MKGGLTLGQKWMIAGGTVLGLALLPMALTAAGLRRRPTADGLLHIETECLVVCAFKDFRFTCKPKWKFSMWVIDDKGERHYAPGLRKRKSSDNHVANIDTWTKQGMRALSAEWVWEAVDVNQDRGDCPLLNIPIFGALIRDPMGLIGLGG